MKILVTGSTGFVGAALVPLLQSSQHDVRVALRPSSKSVAVGVDFVHVAERPDSSDWLRAVRERDVIVHLGARVHVMSEAHSASEYARINTDQTIQLAEAASASGVRRFIYLSSIKVNGERTSPGRPFTAIDVPAPEDAYARSKLEAEHRLADIAARSNMEVVIIRPVLVYGPGVRANFLRMLSWLWRRWPLPFGRVQNRRSLIAIDNLTHVIETTLAHPAAANRVFLVSDGDDLSTTELLRRLGRALGRPARLIPVPALLLRGAAALAGKPDVARRLLESLQVEIAATARTLGWTPRVRVDDALRDTARWFIARQSSRV